MGGKAFLVYLFFKLKRSVSHPHHLAVGMGVGMWANFLPLPGMGITLSLAVTWLLRGSLVGAFVGQMLGNAWTMPLIWVACYKVGLLVFPLGEHGIGFTMLMANFNVAFVMENWSALAKSVLLPLTVGGQIIGIPLALLSYWFTYVEMKNFQDYRHKIREEKALKRAGLRRIVQNRMEGGI
jgi:uncharacterized protein (DUF2062 family)